jgi:cyclopropane fatty-acyl-phospholipid synthase-like methyltransferase
LAGWIMTPFSIFDPRRVLSNPSAYRLCQGGLRRSSTYKRLAEYLAIKPGQRVLDIGCGPADILAWLPSNIEYHGFDAEARYIAAARQRYGDRGMFHLRVVSPHAIDDLGTFDVVICIGVLHHLSDSEVETVFRSAQKVLRPGGRIVTCDGAYVKGQSPAARVLLMLDRGRHVRFANDYVSLARKYFPNVGATIVHDLIAIPYTHCVLEASLSVKS